MSVNASRSPDHPIIRSPDHPIPHVWVDTDIALGSDGGDVDDGFALAALAAAHRRGAIELLGVSTVFGNTTAARSQECARELLARAGVEVPVLRGAERREAATPASEAIAAVSGNNIKIVSLGPLTNLAGACRRDAGLPDRATLRAVGGNLSSLGFLPPLWPYEFNLSRDRESARRVLSLRWRRLTLFPLDVVRQITVGSEDLAALARVSGLGGYLAEQSQRWLRRARWRHLGRRFPLWDLPAALDTIGVLSSEIEPRRLAPGARWLLRDSRAFSCLTDFDPPSAWKSFLHLLEEPDAAAFSLPPEPVTSSM